MSMMGNIGASVAMKWIHKRIEEIQAEPDHEVAAEKLEKLKQEIEGDIAAADSGWL